MLNDDELLKEVKHFENFFFLVFEPNPSRDIVRVWVDGEDMKYIYKRNDFYRIIHELINYEVEDGIKVACSYYGGFFFLDRVRQKITRLSNANERKIFSLKQLHNDIEAAKKRNQSPVEVNFIERANQYLKLCQFGQPKKHHYGNMVNSDIGTVNYNVYLR